MSLEGLTRLEAWKRAKGFAVTVYREALPLLPAEEKWGLAQQLRWAAQSIPANIAEGYGRFYYQETVRFCYIARGSLDETLSHLTLGHELGYLPKEIYTRCVQEGEEVSRLLNGYIAYLKRTRQGADEPGAPQAVAEEAEPYLAEAPTTDLSTEPQP
jgi:four helix bundle protein